MSRESGTEKKLVNGEQHSVWFVPTGMKGLPRNVLLNFRLEFPKSDLTIYLPSRISEIFCQLVSTPEVGVQLPSESTDENSFSFEKLKICILLLFAGLACVLPRMTKPPSVCRKIS